MEFIPRKMEAFLPSEIGRLIYGYLFQQCGEDLANEFLNTCDAMQECRLFKQKYAKNFHSKVQDLSLENILDQYSVLCSIIFQNTVGEEPLHRNILDLLKKLLDSKSGSSDLSGKKDVKKVRANKKTSPPPELREQCDSAIDELSIFSLSASDITENITPADRIDENLLVRSSSFLTAMDVSPTVADSTKNTSENMSLSNEPKLPVSDKKCSPNAKSKRENKKKEKLPSASNQPNSKPKQNCPKLVDIKPKLVNTNSQNIDMAEDLTIVKVTHGISDSSSVRGECSSEETVSKMMSVAKSKSQKKSLRSVLRKKENINEKLEKLPVKKKAAVELCAKTNSFGRPTEVLDVSTKTPETTTAVINMTEVPIITGTDAISKTDTSDVNTLETAMMTSTVAKVTELPIVSTVASGNTKMPVMSTSAISTTEVSVLSAVAKNTEKVSTANSKVLENTEEILSVSSLPLANEIITVPTVKNVFGDLSFVSECSQPSALDESTSSEKSVKENNKTDKINSPECKSSPHKAVATFSETVKTSTESETAVSDEKEDDLPWDLKLRLFVAADSSVNSHITKRKPPDLRSKKRKETPKKRKINESLDENPTNAKRVKSDEVASRSKSITAELAEIGNIGSSKSDLPKRQRRTQVEKPISCGNDKKKDENKKSRNRTDKKATEITGESLKFISMTDIIDFSKPVVEKGKTIKTEKTLISEKRSITDQKKPTFLESDKLNYVVSKSTSVTEEIVEHGESSVENKKNVTLVSKPVTTEKKKQDVDEKKIVFKEPNPPRSKSSTTTHVKEPSIVDNNLNLVEEAQECDSTETGEILKECQSSTDNKQDECNDSRYNDDLDFEMVLEISSEFVLFSKASQC